jgi:phytoene dehydrogenase-like protein
VAAGVTVPDSYDVAIIGAGHNGLVAATYLARAGLRVIALEKRSAVGGAVAVERNDGFTFLPGSSMVGSMRPEVVAGLGLAGQGIEFLPVDPAVVGIGRGGRVVRIWRDPARTSRDLASLSPADAKAFLAYESFLTGIATVLDPLLLRSPISLKGGIRGISKSEQFFLLRRLVGIRRLGPDRMYDALRVPPMSAADVLNEWFQDDLLKATLAMDAIFGANAGPQSPGTGLGLVLSHAPEGRMAGSLVRGGMGELAKALGSAATAAGVRVRTDAEVAHITTKDGRAVGVELANGERISARAIVSNADPKRTLLNLLDVTELEPRFVLRLKNYHTAGTVAKVNLALSSLPSLATGDGMPSAHMRLAPDMEYMEYAFDDSKYGDFSRHPILDLVVPTMIDPSLAPAGKHVLSATVQYAPYALRNGGWEDSRESLLKVVVDTLDEFLPGIRKLIVRTSVLTPPDLEREFGLTGGHIFHGEMSLNQMYVLRPVAGFGRYRMPVPGLYLCGSGTHPGGGVTGAPGFNAAQAVLKDLR